MPQNDRIDSLIRQMRPSQTDRQTLLKSVLALDNLPVPSPSIMKSLLLLRDDNVKMELLVESIERDQTLVAQILKLVNSGFYGLRRTVDSVEKAITMIGLVNVKRMVYSASIVDFFSDEEQVEWCHSYSSSLLASAIIAEKELHDCGSLHLSMILHDIGKVALRRFSPRKYNFALQNAMAHRMPVCKVEDSLFQMNHAEAGALLLAKWNIGDEVVKPVLHHHCESVPPEMGLQVAVAQFANWVDSRVRGISAGEPSLALLDMAGLLDLDSNYWMNYQSNLIQSLEFSLFTKAASPAAVRRELAPRAPAAPSNGTVKVRLLRGHISPDLPAEPSCAGVGLVFQPKAKMSATYPVISRIRLGRD